MEKKIFKKSISPAELYFEVFYVIYIGLLIFQNELSAAFVVFFVGIFIFTYLLLIRPYSYSITRKTLVIHRRLGKDREVNLMTCETITDPIAKMMKIITNPHSLEIYTEGRERIVVSPKMRLAFVQEVLVANKRIQAQVKDYAANNNHNSKKNRK